MIARVHLILFARLGSVRLVVGPVRHGFLHEHRRQHDLLHRADLLVQVDDAVHVLLDLQVHGGRVVLLGVVFEHNHAVFLIDGSENLTGLELERRVNEVQRQIAIDYQLTICGVSGTYMFA